mgnify:CR=1 FL=1
MTVELPIIKPKLKLETIEEGLLTSTETSTILSIEMLIYLPPF